MEAKKQTTENASKMFLVCHCADNLPRYRKEGGVVRVPRFTENQGTNCQ